MEFIRTIETLAEWIRKKGNESRILVPTMGALHEGHLCLCDLARERAGTEGKVIVSLFVNPVQFGPGEDFDAYPRVLDEDLAACQSRGVDLVFAPDERDMYLPDASLTVSENHLSTGLCGASRPGHFDGVCLVVTKLFHLVRPHAAVFGEKDFQQLAVIRRLVRDLNFDIEIIGAPTVRELDGLAMSSRNALLSEEERKAAPVIYRSLREVRDAIVEGRITSPAEGLRELRELMASIELARIDYLEIVDPNTLEPLTEFAARSGDSKKGLFRIIVAVRFSQTRLIDNIGRP